MEKRSKILEVPVLIVVAGPAGLTAALLLRKYGIDALTINRYGWTANTPRAHYQNQRSIEILRELGLQDEVVSAGLPEDLAICRVDTDSRGRGVRPYSHVHGCAQE